MLLGLLKLPSLKGLNVCARTFTELYSFTNINQNLLLDTMQMKTFSQ